MSGAAQKLKQLQTALQVAIDDHQIKKAHLQQAQYEEIYAYDKLKKLQTEIATLHDVERDLIITEHAYVRFFERVLGYDLEKVKEQIMPKMYRDRYLKARNAHCRIDDSHIATIKDGKVLTVTLPPHEPPKIYETKEDELTEGDLSEIEVTDENDEGQDGTSL